MNKKWCIHKRFSPVYTEILGSDFVSLAMYHGLGDDFRSVFGQLRPFFFPFLYPLLPPLLCFFLKCRKRRSGCVSGRAGHADQVGRCACHPSRHVAVKVSRFRWGSLTLFCAAWFWLCLCYWSRYNSAVIFCICNIVWSLISNASVNCSCSFSGQLSHSILHYRKLIF